MNVEVELQVGYGGPANSICQAKQQLYKLNSALACILATTAAQQLLSLANGNMREREMSSVIGHSGGGEGHSSTGHSSFIQAVHCVVIGAMLLSHSIDNFDTLFVIVMFCKF